MGWLLENWGTILVCAILILIVALVIRSMIKDKKKGSSSCGGGCAHCPSSCMCHKV